MLILINSWSRLKVFCLSSMLVLQSCSNSTVTILNGQNQEMANNAILVLGQNGITATKRSDSDNLYSIVVSNQNQTQALEVLKSNGQPRAQLHSWGEIFKKDSFISSPLEEEARFIYALNQEVTSMLLQLNGVVDATVEISLPKVTDSLWKSSDSQSAASVVIKYKPEYKINLYTQRIKRLVANAVPELSANRVEVLTIPVDNIY